MKWEYDYWVNNVLPKRRSIQITPDNLDWNDVSWNYKQNQRGYDTLEEAIAKVTETGWHRNIHVRLRNDVTGEVVPTDIFDLRRNG